MANFIQNYRETVDSIPFTKISKNVDKSGEGYRWSNMFPEKTKYTGEDILVEKAGYDRKTNPLVFRDANQGEKTGRQKITLIDQYGDKEDIYLVVPEKEVVGYGNIVGWGSPDSQNFSMTKDTYKNASSGLLYTGHLLPLTALADLTLGNMVENNTKKQELSKYTGEDKAVGLSESGQSEGQILGLVDAQGNTYTAKEAENFLENLINRGYMGIESYETPKKVQEHNGPAYVPGDLLLGLLGLRPNRGAVAYKFKEPKYNNSYQTFLRNLRNLDDMRNK